MKTIQQTQKLSAQEKSFVKEIRDLIVQSRSRTYSAVNAVMVQTYWQIGKRIVEQEQNGKSRADYGAFLIKNLSIALAQEFGQGLSVANLWNFRQFYLTYPTEEKLYTVCRLSWSHVRLIMRVDSEKARDYYANEAATQKYSVLNEYKQIFASKYKTVLPTEEEMKREIESKTEK